MYLCSDLGDDDKCLSKFVKSGNKQLVLDFNEQIQYRYLVLRGIYLIFYILQIFTFGLSWTKKELLLKLFWN